jgi:hypothetical protein
MKSPGWSYSALTKFETCPRQYALVRVYKKVKEQYSAPASWGVDVHKALELRVLNKIPLPEALQKWEPLVAKFDTGQGQVHVEHKVALTRNLTQSEWRSPSTWVRAVIDLVADRGKHAVLLDWKTGKVRPGTDQLKLTAAIWMSMRPWVERVKTGFAWLAHNKMTREEFSRDDVPVIWADFMARVHRLDEAYDRDRWPPKPSGLCRGWCPVGREHCEFWEPKPQQR